MSCCFVVVNKIATESLACDFAPKMNAGVGIIAPADAIRLGSGTRPPSHRRLLASCFNDSLSKLARLAAPVIPSC